MATEIVCEGNRIAGGHKGLAGGHKAGPGAVVGDLGGHGGPPLRIRVVGDRADTGDGPYGDDTLRAITGHRTLTRDDCTDHERWLRGGSWCTCGTPTDHRTLISSDCTDIERQLDRP